MPAAGCQPGGLPMKRMTLPILLAVAAMLALTSCANGKNENMAGQSAGMRNTEGGTGGGMGTNNGM